MRQAVRLVPASPPATSGAGMGPAQPPLPDAPPLGFGTLVPISQLPPLIAPLVGSEPVPLVQQGVTRRGQVNDFLALVPEGVTSFNGRTGDVVLTYADLIAAGGSGLFTLYYLATQGQIVFPTGIPDMFGRSADLVSSLNLAVYRNGSLLTPDDGTGIGDYTINIANSTVTLLLPAGAQEVIAVSTAPIAMPPVPAPLNVQLYYVATAGQTAFPTTTPDKFGQTATLPSSNIVVARNGLILAPDDGSGFGGYTVSIGASTVTLLFPAGAGEIVIISIAQGEPSPQLYGFVTEPVTVTSTNHFGDLKHPATGVVGILYVNGIAYSAPDVAFFGKTITWNNLIYSVAPTDTVFAYYSF